MYLYMHVFIYCHVYLYILHIYKRSVIILRISDGCVVYKLLSYDDIVTFFIPIPIVQKCLTFVH